MALPVQRRTSVEATLLPMTQSTSSSGIISNDRASRVVLSDVGPSATLPRVVRGPEVRRPMVRSGRRLVACACLARSGASADIRDRFVELGLRNGPGGEFGAQRVGLGVNALGSGLVLRRFLVGTQRVLVLRFAGHS